MSCKTVWRPLLTISMLLPTGCAIEHDRFHYDYVTLRIGGMVFAGFMLTIGIIVLLSDCNLLKRNKKETCKVTSYP
ncbi:sodium/potassium-transporting ATPase subunit gamma-like [Dendropsophus ebraccatus]|uniref:sodium/potassium-transporting ATPase subunit gamma-like n=1 Tax=Dendropsophus ebraccatus TaxID=150705 RepID=UPI0038310202